MKIFNFFLVFLVFSILGFGGYRFILFEEKQHQNIDLSNEEQSLGTNSLAVQFSEGIFWQITEPTTGAKSYLLGTSDASDPRLDQVVYAVKPYIKRSRIFLQGIPTHSSDQLSHYPDIFNNKKRTTEALPPDMRAIVLKRLMEVKALYKWIFLTDIQIDDLDAYTPEVLAEILLNPAIEVWENQYDKISEVAKASALFVKQVDVPGTDYNDFITAWGINNLFEYVRYTAELTEIERCQIHETEISRYLGENTGELIDAFDSQIRNILPDGHEIISRLILLDKEFNETFFERLAPELNEGGAFFTVDAWQLPGTSGVLSLLSEKGYAVERVSLNLEHQSFLSKDKSECTPWFAPDRPDELLRTWQKAEVLYVNNQEQSDNNLIWGEMGDGNASSRLSQALKGKKVPIIIYSHGSTGNLSAKFNIFKRVSKELGSLIIVPSHNARKLARMGQSGASYSDWIFDARRSEIHYAISRLKELSYVDTNNIYVVGFSEGGDIASRLTDTELAGRVIVGWDCRDIINGGFKENYDPVNTLVIGAKGDRWVGENPCPSATNKLVIDGSGHWVLIYPEAQRALISFIKQRITSNKSM